MILSPLSTTALLTLAIAGIWLILINRSNMV